MKPSSGLEAVLDDFGRALCAAQKACFRHEQGNIFPVNNRNGALSHSVNHPQKKKNDLTQRPQRQQVDAWI
jgi:hypothetical protein